jgi:DNA-directed RNA polymerase specialized sigma24 family protein
MQHAEHTPHPATWQDMAGRLAGLVAWHAARLCKAHVVPPDQREDVVGEALVALCVGVKNAWQRGARGFDVRFYARHGVAAVLHTRRGRPLRVLGDAAEAALASCGPGPDAEAEAAELLPALLARLPGGRVRQAVRLKAAGLSTAEAAAALGVSRQRVKQLLLKARAVLLAR